MSMGKERKHNEETRMEKQLDASAYCGSVGRCICGTVSGNGLYRAFYL